MLFQAPSAALRMVPDTMEHSLGWGRGQTGVTEEQVRCLGLCRRTQMSAEHLKYKDRYKAERCRAGGGSLIKDGWGTSFWPENIWAGM